MRYRIGDAPEEGEQVVDFEEGTGPCPDAWTFETDYDNSNLDEGMTVEFSVTADREVLI